MPELTFDRLDGIAVLCAAMSQQDVGPDRPLCGSVLPDGQRVQICRPPAVPAGTVSLTIRRPNSFAPSLSMLAQGGLFAGTDAAQLRAHPADAELVELHRAKDWPRFLALAVRAHKTIMASGDTGSGKTTVAKALIQEIPEHERLVTIEDTAEFNLSRRNVASLFYSKGDQGLARVRSEDLIEAALRMRPDRVLMQELRDGAAFSFIRGIAAGHPGSITTLHAGSAAGAFDALRLMVKQHDAGKHLADADVRTFLRQLVDVVVHCDEASRRLPHHQRGLFRSGGQVRRRPLPRPRGRVEAPMSRLRWHCCSNGRCPPRIARGSSLRRDPGAVVGHGLGHLPRRHRPDGAAPWVPVRGLVALPGLLRPRPSRGRVLAQALGGLAIGVPLLLVVAGIARKGLPGDRRALHGETEWAGMRELRENELLAGSGGLYVGKLGCSRTSASAARSTSPATRRPAPARASAS